MAVPVRSPATRSALAGLLSPLLVAAAVAGCNAKPAPPEAARATAAAPIAAAQPAGVAAVAKAGAALASAETGQAEAKAKRRKEAVAAAHAKVARQGLPEGTGALPNIEPGGIERQVLRARTAPGEHKELAPRWMVKRIKNVAANHDKGGVQRWCTPRLAAEIDTMLVKHSERFWRHLDRYAVAAAQGYEVTAQRKEGEDRLHLTVKAKGDIVLKPVLVHTAEGWRFERF